MIAGVMGSIYKEIPVKIPRGAVKDRVLMRQDKVIGIKLGDEVRAIA